MSDSIRLEMTWTAYGSSCRDPHVDPTGHLRECRRHAHHTGTHASDHPYYQWSEQ